MAGWMGLSGILNTDMATLASSVLVRLIGSLGIWLAMHSSGALAMGPTEIPNEQGLRFYVSPPDTEVSEDLEGGVISGGNQSPVYVNVHRKGTLVSMTNQKREFICDIDLVSHDRQTCFGRKFTIDEVFPLSRFGTAFRPFVIAGKIGDWPVAIFAGLDGIPSSDRCKRFISTVSEAAHRLATAVCPDAVDNLSPIQGTVFQYKVGTTERPQQYSVQLTMASYDDLKYQISTGGPPIDHKDGPIALSRLMPLFTWCKTIIQGMYVIAEGQSISCDRTSSAMAWRDKISFLGMHNVQDPRLATTLKSYRLELKGTAENTHSSVLEAEIWLEIGAPLRVRYLATSGYGPAGIPPNTAYTETLTQVNLPPP
jgi:hypothetical protein